jgi:hypothetical protein
MSNLNHYVRQLRPRTESYIPHVDRIQDLLSEGVVGKYNKGDVAEAILGAAVAAKFIIRPVGDISKKDVEDVLKKVLASNPVTVQVADYKKTTKSANITDNIKFKVGIPKPAMDFVSDSSNWSSISDLFSSALSYVNSDRRLNLQAIQFSKNHKSNTIFVNSDGTGDQTGTKADIKLTFDGKKSRNQISLKVKGGDQFAQIGGIPFAKQEKLWKDGLGLDVSTLKIKYETELEKFDPTIVFTDRTDEILQEQRVILKNAARAVYAEAVTQMNAKFGSKDVDFVKKLIQFIKTGVAGTEYKDIELVKLEKGDFKTLRFNAKLESLISDMNLVAVMKEDKDPEVEIKDSESGKPLIKIRFKVEGQSRKSKSGTTYTLYPRNLIEMPSNSLLYGGANK